MDTSKKRSVAIPVIGGVLFVSNQVLLGADALFSMVDSVLRVLMLFGLVLSIVRSPLLNRLGFVALWWFPCVEATLLTSGFGGLLAFVLVRLEATRGELVLRFALVALVEAIVMAFWLQPKIERFFDRRFSLPV